MPHTSSEHPSGLSTEAFPSLPAAPPCEHSFNKQLRPYKVRRTTASASEQTRGALCRGPGGQSLPHFGHLRKYAGGTE